VTRNKRHNQFLAMLSILVLVAVACGRDDDDDGGAAGDGDGEVSAVAGFDGDTIRVGAITPQSGVAAVIGNPLTAGNQVYFQALNEEEGGIAGRYPVEIEIGDSRYEPPTAVQVYNGMKDDVVMLVQLLGTPITTAVLPQLEADNLVASPASLDAEWVREPNLLPLGGPYQIQAINAMEYYLTEGGGEGSTICTLTKDDPYGEAGLQGMEFAAEEMDFEIAVSATFSPGTEDFTAQINQLSGANCEMVWLTSLPTEASPILEAAAGLGFEPQWIGQSPTWVSLFAQTFAESNFLLVGEGPEWGDESVPGMAQMLEDVEQYMPDQEPDIYFAFGYAQAWATAQLLEQAVENGDLSREGMLEALESLDVLEFGGLFGDYNYGEGGVENRNPPRVSTIFEIDPAAPGGLSALDTNFTSDAAKDFEFEGG
jgi:ABC-type branched-subunit amino acid transport system substrate-binding protein